MNRVTLNIAMAIVLIGLAVAVYFTKRHTRPAPKPPLTSLNSAGIKTITISRRHGKGIRLAKEHDRWRLTEPVSAAADPYEVKQVLGIATAPCEKAIKPASVKLSNLGLSPPHYTVTFDKTTVDVGEVEPLKYRRYMKAGNHICLVKNPTTPALGGSYASLVSKHLVNSAKALVAIDLPNFELKRNHAKSWSVDPAQSGTAKGAARTLAQNWASAESEWNETVPAGSNPPADAPRVRLHFKGGKTLDFLIIKRKPHLVLERPGTRVRYVFSREQAGSLLELEKKGKSSSPAKPAAPASAVAPTSS